MDTLLGESPLQYVIFSLLERNLLCKDEFTSIFYSWKQIIFFQDRASCAEGDACAESKYMVTIIQPAHDKTYNKTCATREDQPVH